ncbi:MAG: aminotransferase class III-fold pyridoxal phosphate-dependent enzyme, partial [Acidobacteria bacterium]|nr:aminotransferase class III-fold pyridoxal phosphate-dependent enzyme [Acidobacteriota bacterium]
TQVRGLGLMVAAEINSADLAKATVPAMQERGVIINRTHETALRFLPPYTIKKKHIDEVVKALEATLSHLEPMYAKPQAQNVPEAELLAQGSTH